MVLHTPQIVGIVNVTEDSFSDGGAYLQPDAAIAHAKQQLEDGAFFAEFGPASSHPDAKGVSAEEEIKRIEPLLEAFAKQLKRVSIDSFQPETQVFAARKGVGMINDIQGFPHQATRQQLAAFDCALVVMHSVQRYGIATRENTEAHDVIQGMYNFFERRIAELISAGIQEQRIILDPGMGFFLGSTPEPSIEMLRRLAELRRTFGLPVLVSVSRKSFLKTITQQEGDGLESATLSAELYASDQGADYIRTHNVQGIISALQVREQLGSYS